MKTIGCRTQRFSKQVMIDDLQMKIACLEAKYKFRVGHGSRQVEGKSEEILIAYGHYAAFRDLLSQIQDKDF